MSLEANASLGSETLQQLFDVTEKELASGITPDKLENAALDRGDDFAKQLATAGWSGVSNGLASQLTTFLQDDLVGVFAGCWAKYDELQKCAEESRKDPKGATEAALADHEFSWEMEPSVEIKLNGVKLTNIPFKISFVFAVSALELMLQAGAIQAVHTGKCDCRGEIGCGGQRIWSRTLTHVDLPGKLQLKHPIKLGHAQETKSQAAGAA